jgi:acyl-[acyl-carrier-protein]-phospholipid O-acyltransferase / long-chain-fatty-acid--[acyl-carrier-protein] ligase
LNTSALLVACASAAAASIALGLGVRTRAGTVLVRKVLRALIRTIYSIRVDGGAHVPRAGGALLVANHVSYADAFLLGACVERPVRFLMHRAFYEHALFGPFARWVGAIPIASGESQAERDRSLGEAVAALQGGALVAIFAEGRITRTGALLGFRRGLEAIARQAGVPIVPAALDEVWGSIFSFEGGRALSKWPRQLPYRVRVSFGAPLRPEAPAHRVRDAIGEQLAISAERRALRETDLARAFVRSARAHPSRSALIEASGREHSYRQLLASALALSDELRGRLGDARWVGVLVPEPLAAVELLLALALDGRAALALDPLQGPLSALELARRAELSHVIASADGLAQLGMRGWVGPARLTYAAELREAAANRAATGSRLARLPAAWILRARGQRLPRASDPAAALSTSGTSGAVRAAVLSHASIGSNARALAQVAQVGPGDLVAAALPFAHAYGTTVTLWAPLLAGSTLLLAGALPEPEAFARLVRAHKPSVLVGTPSMYEAWLAHLARSDVERVRLAICGGEHLPSSLAAAWKDELGVALLEGYGATELGPVVCANFPDVERGGLLQHNQQPGTVGRPLPGVAVRVARGASEDPADPDELGRILVRGPGRMLGYLGEPEATERALRAGWCETGDVGALDRDGFLTVADRRERFAMLGEALVAHSRIEEALRARLSKSAGELAVVAWPSNQRRIAVVHNLRAVDLEQLRNSAIAAGIPAAILPPPREWIAVERLPRQPSGKLDLRSLERRLSEGEARPSVH